MFEKEKGHTRCIPHSQRFKKTQRETILYSTYLPILQTCESQGGTGQEKVWSYAINSNIESEFCNANLYGLSYDPKTQLLYAATSSGIDPAEALIYDLDGQLQGNFDCRFFTNGFVFK